MILYVQKPVHIRLIRKLFLFKFLGSLLAVLFVLSIFLMPVTLSLLFGLGYGIVTGVYYASLGRFFGMVQDLLECLT